MTEAGRPRPNIVFVFADQMRASAMGCMGNGQVRTPQIDALAAEGTLLTNAISGHPLCSPYRAMLLTGRYCQSTGLVSNDIPLPDHKDTLARAFKRHGYHTGYIGKWHLEARRSPYVTRERHQGFDYWVSENCDHDYFDTPVCFNGDPELKTLKGYQPNAQTDLAIDYINAHKDAPFLLCMSWGPPHNPYVAPEDYMKLYDPSDIKQRPNVQGDHTEDIAHHYAQITNLDHNIGRLIRAIEDAGIRDDTVFVFTSDHGDMLGSQGRAGKQLPWEESIHVPFVLRYPRVAQAGVIRGVMLNTVDIMPTLLSLAGLPIPTSVEGRDLSPSLLGEPAEEPDSVLLQAILPCHGSFGQTDAWRGVRTKRYTYARFRDKNWVLYDNEADPYQLNNLIDKPEARQLQKQLEDELQAWLERTNDDFASREEWKHRVEAATGLPGIRFDEFRAEWYT